MIRLQKLIEHRCVIHITGGDSNRFINLCRHAGLPVYDLVPDETGLFATMRYRDYEKAGTFEEKSGCRCSVVLERGLAVMWRKYRKKSVFFCCMLAFFGVLFYASRFIWQIRVTGDDTAYTQEEIISYTSSNLVGVGTKKKNIDLAELEYRLRQQYEDIAWITCEMQGTCLIIHMMETIPVDTIPDEEEPCNIVAVRDGLVTDLIATSGTKLAEPGDEVKKGDILITGVVNVYNEYEELIETNYVPASGVVYGQTVYRYEERFPMEYVEKKQGKKKYAVFLQLGTRILRIFSPRDVDAYEQTEQMHTLHIGRTYYLPVGICVRTYWKPEYKTCTYTEEEAVRRQEEILRKYIENLKKKGVEILENNVKIECSAGICCASGTLVVREVIGVPERLTVPPAEFQSESEIQ